jgi:hypothetical protein
VRGFHQGKKFDVDLFWLQPVVPHGERFDSVDNNVNFFGLWTTYRPRKGVAWDNYYLFQDNTGNLEQLGIVRAPVNFHTLGTRYAGDKDNFLWDAEVMFQFGERGDQGLFAAATSLGAGYNWPKHPLNPTFWLYYDFASGDQNPGSGDSFNTFNQLYPFGHYYLGWLDLVGRQNIHDLNAHLYLWPTKWIMVWLQYHHFELASSRDALYNAGGNATRRDASGKAGHHVGDEFDLVFNFHLGYHSDILVGYSHMFPGRFLRETGDPTPPGLFYAMYSFRW